MPTTQPYITTTPPKLTPAKTALEQHILDHIKQPINIADWETAHQPLLTRDPSAGDLSAEFLTDLICHPNHDHPITPRGITLTHINRPFLTLTLNFTELNYPLSITHSTFKTIHIQGITARASLTLTHCTAEHITLKNLEAEDDIDLTESHSDHLKIENSTVHGDLILNRGDHDTITLNGLKLAGDLKLRALRSSQNITLNVPHIDGLIDITEGNTKSIRIDGGKVGRNIQLDQITITSDIVIRNTEILGVLNASSSQIGNIAAHSINIKGDFNIISSEVKGIKIFGGLYESIILLIDCKVNGELVMQRAEVYGSLFIRKSKISDDIDISYNSIQNSVAMEETTFVGFGRTIDFTGTTIGGEFRTHQAGDKYKLIPWGKQKLCLRNCTTKSFQDHPDVWPDEIDITGFSYSYISGRGKSKDKTYTASSPQEFADRDIKWMIQFLAKQKNFNPQPYWHLARVLKQLGHEKKATAILYECAKKQMNNTPNYLSRQTKRIHAILNGYGYYNRRVIYWGIIFTIIGMCILNYTEETHRLNLNNGLLYSLDMLIPVIEFNAKYYSKNYTLEHPIAEAYFVLHQTIGYILAIMAISGLNKIAREEH